MKLWISKTQYGFSTRLKDGNENGASMFLNVQFRKGQEPEGNCQIETKGNEFLSCFNSKNGVQPKLVVLDYSIIAGHNSDNAQPEKAKEPEKTSYTADELADEALA